MLDLSPDKIFVLAILALLVLGPNRLPQAARTAGRLIGQLRALTNSVHEEVREALHDPHEAVGTALSEFRPSGVARTVRREILDTFAAPSAPADRPAAAGQVPAPSSWTGHPDDPGLN